MFKCEECKMTFTLKWFLGIHVSIHIENDVLKFCHLIIIAVV